MGVLLLLLPSTGEVVLGVVCIVDDRVLVLSAPDPEDIQQVEVVSLFQMGHGLSIGGGVNQQNL